jgi:hypothetical protein
LITLSQSSLSTNDVQVPVSIQSPTAFDPSSDVVQFAFTPYTYPTTVPGSGDWHNGSWAVFAGPSYWAQITVGPANGGIVLARRKWSGWIKVTDSPAVPVEQCFLLQITP